MSWGHTTCEGARRSDGEWDFPAEHAAVATALGVGALCAESGGDAEQAIVHQEALLGLLTSNSPDSASLEAHCSGHAMAADTIAPPVLRALKAKVENSMDWYHLALCRLREIVLHTSPASPSAQPSMGSCGGAGLLSSYSKGDAKQYNIQPSTSRRTPSWCRTTPGAKPLGIRAASSSPTRPRTPSCTLQVPGDALCRAQSVLHVNIDACVLLFPLEE